MRNHIKFGHISLTDVSLFRTRNSDVRAFSPLFSYGIQQILRNLFFFLSGECMLYFAIASSIGNFHVKQVGLILTAGH